jgi:hypothetical protein
VNLKFCRFTRLYCKELLSSKELIILMQRAAEWMNTLSFITPFLWEWTMKHIMGPFSAQECIPLNNPSLLDEGSIPPLCELPRMHP